MNFCRLPHRRERGFGAPDASANAAATGATVSGTQTGHSTVRTLPNGAGVADVTRQSGIPGLSLNPSTLTFQLVIGDLTGNTANSVQVDLGQPPVTGPMSVQQYEVLLDPNYVADRQQERAEMQQKIDHFEEAEWIRGQQVSHGSAQTVQMHEPPLLNSTAIGALNDDACQPGLAVEVQHSMYVPTMELADKRQAAACNNSALLNSYMPLGMHVRTNVPPSEVQDIDVPTAMAMHKVHIQKFCASICKWNR